MRGMTEKATNPMEQKEDPATLPVVAMDPGEFADFARDCGWDDKTVSLILKPLPDGRRMPGPFCIGEGGTRCRVRLVSPVSLNLKSESMA
jgi:hypothetical protein